MEHIVKDRERFSKWASPLMLGFAMMCGLIFAALSVVPLIFPGRLLFSILLISGSLFAFSYTEPRAMRSRTVPLMVEVLRFKFLLWFLFGIVWLIRIAGNDPPPQSQWAVILIGFLVGSIAGGVFGLGFLLFLGRKSDIAVWDVVRFPVWTVAMSEWLKRRFHRGR